MDAIMAIAARHQLLVVEDAAQGIMSSYKGRPLGSIGSLGTFSFHETKNVISGEGGAILINDGRLVEEGGDHPRKGHQPQQVLSRPGRQIHLVRHRFVLPARRAVAAFLSAQLREAEEITRRRLVVWDRYHEAFEQLEREGLAKRPMIPPDCRHNAHMYFLLLPTLVARTAFIEAMKKERISTVFHYVPLHSSPAGLRFGRASGNLAITENVADRLVRLPLWVGLEQFQDRVIEAAMAAASR